MLKLEYADGHVNVGIKTDKGVAGIAYELTMCVKAVVEAMDDKEDKAMLKMYIDGPMAKVANAKSEDELVKVLMKDLAERFGDEAKHKQD